jgi:hypothetical protein
MREGLAVESRCLCDVFLREVSVYVLPDPRIVLVIVKPFGGKELINRRINASAKLEKGVTLAY